MKLKSLIVLFFLLSSDSLFAQFVLLKGKVFDAKDITKLSNVTVKIGKQTFTTDKNGYFELTTSLKSLNDNGINFSCIGYLNTHLIYEPNHFYNVGLVENTTQLNEVVIGAGEDIIKKAIKRIPENYPNKPITIKGILRTQTWRNQSEYFKADAVIMAYIPSYDSKEKTIVSVLSNRIDTIYDKSLRYFRQSSNYNVVDFQDIAHSNYIMKRISQKNKFDYLYAGKQLYNNHKVFVINTILRDTSKQHNRIDATLYIDTASYAFVASNIFTYNLVRKGLLTLKVLNYKVDYEKNGNRWYLKNTHTSASFELDKQSPQTTIDFIRTEIDSVNAQTINYRDAVQRGDNVLLIDKPMIKEDRAKIDSLFRKAENEGKMEIISENLLDTIKKNNAIANQKQKKTFRNRIFDYITKDNIRAILALYKFPLVINNQFSSVSEIVNYGLGLGANFRLLKNLFLGFQVNTNFWNNKHVDLSTTTLSLSNDFILNKKSRNITITPYVGFERANVKYEKVKDHFESFNYGLRVSYELTHKKALFFSSGFNSNSNITTVNGLTLNPTNYSIGLGIIFKR